MRRRGIDKRAGLQIVRLEEIAWRNGRLDDQQSEAVAAALDQKNSYGQYLNGLLSQSM
jgi:hypothetical protein